MQNSINTNKYRRTAFEFPSGIATTEYPNWESWTYREWAWQFLRRREDYIESCDEINECEKAGRKKLLLKNHCEYFSLKNYKSYTSNRPPRFNISAIDVWDHLSNDTQPLKKKIKKGEIIIRFNIKTNFNSHKSLNKQLKNAKAALLQKTIDYGYFSEGEDKRNYNHVLFRNIRLLDLLRYQCLNQTLTNEDICDYLYDADGWNDKQFNNDKKGAKEYLDKYREIATILKPKN